MKTLTAAEFAAVEDKINAALRATKRGTPERAEHEAKAAGWEAAYALPQTTAAQRETRHAAIALAAQDWS